MNYTVNNTDRPVYLQIYRQIRDDITSGVFPYNSRLPSKRLLADELGVSTITVEHAYSLLCDEGYTESRERSGYFVIFSPADGFASSAPVPVLPKERKAPPASYPGFPISVLSKTMRKVITEYYDTYFNGFDGFTPPQREDLRKSLLIDERNKNGNRAENETELNARIETVIDEIERRRKELKVESLSFNTFYEFSVQRIPDICNENSITGIDISTYRYMMKDFYRGGNHDKTLNENMDSSLFDETFIVFEIDSIKDDPLLFPLVTLIIMDVFLQKMRIKKNRKVLVIEEAWKAIASPLMAEYIKFMYKTARKFWASVGVVTQEIQDIIGSEIVKEAIINNSDVVMLLDQSKFRERFDTIKAILGLTDVDCKKIFTINRLENKEGRSFFREVFIRRGTTSGVYGVEEPHECYMTYTTERAEKEALKLYKAELQCSHKEAIERYCADWDASGISKSLPFAQKVNAAGKVLNLHQPKTKQQ